MLILTRKIDESIIIGDNIKVRVLELKGRQVRLGIEAPSHWPVHREEVYLRIQEQNLKSLAPQMEDFSAVAELWAKTAGPTKGQAK